VAATKQVPALFFKFGICLASAEFRNRMQVHYQLDALPPFRNAVVTIGTFDGVHTGHQKIVNQLLAEAKEANGKSVIITFDPHPRTVVNPGAPPLKLINTLPEKLQLLQSKGIDHVVVVPFTKAFADQPALDYVKDFLVAKFQPHSLIIGYDHRFGHNREGDYQLLEKLKHMYGFRLKEIPAKVLHHVTVGSTRIRETLQAGLVDEANALLGYPFFFEGLVVQGNKLGRTIGFPTANLQVQGAGKIIPGHGVYAVNACLPAEGNCLLKGMMNIGIRPTVDGTRETVEVNLFDFDRDIYDQILKVCLIERLRGEVKFSGIDALKAQLADDREHAKKALVGKEMLPGKLIG
jgi:riboflavin kinase/FMN adenylyltransferase